MAKKCRWFWNEGRYIEDPPRPSTQAIICDQDYRHKRNHSSSHFSHQYQCHSHHMGHWASTIDASPYAIPHPHPCQRAYRRTARTFSSVQKIWRDQRKVLAWRSHDTYASPKYRRLISSMWHLGLLPEIHESIPRGITDTGYFVSARKMGWLWNTGDTWGRLCRKAIWTGMRNPIKVY